MKKCPICILVQTLAAVGALNWGLLAFFNRNMVISFFGEGTFAKIVYGLIALSGILMLVCLVKPCPCTGKTCNK